MEPELVSTEPVREMYFFTNETGDRVLKVLGRDGSHADIPAMDPTESETDGNEEPS